MTTRAETIMDAVLAVLATINGAGSYTYDLSGTNAIHEGEPGAADIRGPACVWLDISSVDVTDNQLLTVDTATFTMDLGVFVASTEGTPAKNKRAALRLWSDVDLALYLAFLPAGTLGALTYLTGLRLRMDPNSIHGGGAGLAPSMGSARGKIVATYPSTFGTGV